MNRLLLAGALLGWLAAPRAGSGAGAALPCDGFPHFAEGDVPVRELFVSPSGNDAQGDGSRDRPFRSLGRAAQGLRPGTALRLLPGTHAGGHFLEGVAGTASAPVWIGGVPGEPRPVISGGSGAIHIARARHLVLEHLEIAGATGNGINLDDGGDRANPEAARWIVVRGVRFRDIGTGGNQDALKLSGVRDFWVLDCEFLRGSAGGSGIDHVGCHRGWIAGCRFESMGSNSIQVKGGSEDIEIHGCSFVQGGQRAINAGGSTGFEFFRPPLTSNAPNAEARNVRVIANRFQGSDAPVALVGCVDALIAHNTLVDPSRWVLRVLQETVSTATYSFLPSGRSRFVNNLVVFRRAQVGTIVNVGTGTDAPTVRFENNLWYASDAPAQSRPSLPSPETGGISGLDPRLKDPAAGEIALGPDSPAAGRGVVLPEVRADLGRRCYAQPPTIGAWEAQPPPPPDSDGDGLPDWWERRRGTAMLDPSDARSDDDGDGHDTVTEFRAGTDPADASSVLRLVGTWWGPGGVRLAFPSMRTHQYRLEHRGWDAPGTWQVVDLRPGRERWDEFVVSRESLAPGLYRVRADAAVE